MRNYQTVVILKPDLDDNQVNDANEKIVQLITRMGGQIIKNEKWGKKRLAYRVRRNRFGIYLNLFHTCDSAKVPQLEGEFRLIENIIKFLVVRLEPEELEWSLKGISVSDAREGGEEGAPKKTAAAAAVEDDD